jgi:hypothetical protein
MLAGTETKEIATIGGKARVCVRYRINNPYGNEPSREYVQGFGVDVRNLWTAARSSA